MSGIHNDLINNFTLSLLALVLAVSSVDPVSVPRICGRVEIGRQHERPKLFQVAVVKHAKYNLTHTLETVSPFIGRPSHAQFYQHVKKQTKRIWHESRLSKKQREIINMLWTRKVPIPSNPITFTRNFLFLSSQYKAFRSGKKIKRQDMAENSYKSGSTKTNTQNPYKSGSTSTEAFRAFDYFEDIAELPKNIKLKEKVTTIEKDQRRKIPYVQYVKKRNNLPRLALFTSKPMKTPPPFTGLSEPYLPMKSAVKDAYTSYEHIYHTAGKPFYNKLIPDSEDKIATKKNQRRKISFQWVSENITYTDPTTAEDKVKFFETNDQFTAARKRKRAKIGNIYNKQIDTKPQDNVKVRLVDINQNIPHVDDNYFYSKRPFKRDNSHLNNTAFKKLEINYSINQHEGHKSLRQNDVIHQIPIDAHLKSNKTGISLWEKYPFVAVYIYESSQVHCDAAALSPHWLVTAGACLYRRPRDESPSERSAFVTYCGPDWRRPERIAYVQRSLVHPEYHPRDYTRRHQFNIGLIRVVYSMQSSCAGWAPITLMSQQFVAGPLGSPATAVGWGLDGYAGLDSTSDLAELVEYEGKIYLETCPGNLEYSKLEQIKTKPNPDPNVYCLALPARAVADEDPTHGNILLSRGRLIALFLEEEQRPWAEPSAQYTSVWRLAPWVRETAREPEGTDNITIIDI